MTISQTQPSSQASFYSAGVDLGRKRDHAVIAMVQKRGEEVYLVYLKRFPLMSEYASVLGYLKLLNQRFQDLRRILIDQTGVGDVFVEEAVKSGLKNARGVMLSLTEKQDIMVYLKQRMEDGRVHIPFDRELINEMNLEQYEVTETGQVKYSHPEGTHDDRLWAFALAVYASRVEIPSYHPVAALGKAIKPWWQAPKMTTAPRNSAPAVTSQLICWTCGKPQIPGKEHVH